MQSLKSRRTGNISLWMRIVGMRRLKQLWVRQPKPQTNRLHKGKAKKEGNMEENLSSCSSGVQKEYNRSPNYGSQAGYYFTKAEVVKHCHASHGYCILTQKCQEMCTQFIDRNMENTVSCINTDKKPFICKASTQMQCHLYFFQATSCWRHTCETSVFALKVLMLLSQQKSINKMKLQTQQIAVILIIAAQVQSCG